MGDGSARRRGPLTPALSPDSGGEGGETAPLPRFRGRGRRNCPSPPFFWGRGWVRGRWSRACGGGSARWRAPLAPALSPNSGGEGGDFPLSPNLLGERLGEGAVVTRVWGRKCEAERPPHPGPLPQFRGRGRRNCPSPPFSWGRGWVRGRWSRACGDGRHISRGSNVDSAVVTRVWGRKCEVERPPRPGPPPQFRGRGRRNCPSPHFLGERLGEGAVVTRMWGRKCEVERPPRPGPPPRIPGAREEKLPLSPFSGGEVG